MKKQFITLLFLISQFITWGQSLEDFKTDFKKALDDNFSEKELNNMFRIHSNFLTPHSDVTQLMSSIKGEQIDPYPLTQFKNDPLYTDNIEKLITSQNKNQRILAYLVIAGAGDKSFENTLLKKIKKETDKGCLLWSGMALLYLNTSHTTPLFDFLVENETFGDAHMLPLYMRLNKDSLQQTAYLKINSDKPIAKILAVQLLAFTPVSPKSEALIKTAVKEWDFNTKGYAIFSLKELQIGNLLELLKPLLDSSKTRTISLEALANSPTETDKQYLIELVNKQDSVPEELLDCFYQSKNIDNLKILVETIVYQTNPRRLLFCSFQTTLNKKRFDSN